jgi:hypothetical protein
MRIVPELDHTIRREIGDARAIDPLVSVVDLQEHLEEKFNRTFPVMAGAADADDESRVSLGNRVGTRDEVVSLQTSRPGLLRFARNDEHAAPSAFAERAIPMMHSELAIRLDFRIR